MTFYVLVGLSNPLSGFRTIGLGNPRVSWPQGLQKHGVERNATSKVANVYTMSYCIINPFTESDEKKNRSNFKKHGIWFEEAATVISHYLSREYTDPKHPERTIAVGCSDKNRTLKVIFIELKARI